MPPTSNSSTELLTFKRRQLVLNPIKFFRPLPLCPVICRGVIEANLNMRGHKYPPCDDSLA